MTCSACSMQLKGCSILSAKVLKSGEQYPTTKMHIYIYYIYIYNFVSYMREMEGEIKKQFCV